jgi:ComF family protein
LPWLAPGCARCALPLPGGPAAACGACLARPPRFSACAAAFSYAFPVRELILRFKQGGDLVAGRVLGVLLAQRLASLLTPPPGAVLLPMPLHRARLRQRGFNQAGLLAREIALATGIPLRQALARRERPGRDQKQLGAAERRANLRGAFGARPCTGRCVIVVDDVLTTGASADSLADALLAAGAAEVRVWCVARAL